MTASPKTPTLLAGLALATLATAPALADDATTTTRTEVQKACKVVVLSGDEAGAANAVPHQVMVMARSVDGAEPSMQVNVLGTDGQPGDTFEVQSLDVGETKTFTTQDGREVELTRTEGAVTLKVDGKEITLPSLGNVAMIPAGAAGTMQTLVTEDIVGTAGGDQKVMVFAGAPHVVMGGMPLPMGGHFDNLQALEGVDAGCREKLVEALHEILSQGVGSGFSWTMATDAPEGAAAVAPAPGQHVIVRRVGTPAPAGEGSKIE